MSLLDDFDSVQVSSKPSSASKSILSDFDNTSGTKGVDKSIPGNTTNYPEVKPDQRSFLARGVARHVGSLEAAGTLLTGAVAAPIGAAAGIVKGFTGGKYGTAEGAREAQARASEVASSLTYQPRSEEGQENIGMVSKLMDSSKLAGLGPTEAMMMGGASALPVARGAAQAKPAATGGRMASVGAAGADVVTQARTMAANASPEIKAAIDKAGTKINLQVAERHVQADSLPVPIRLTKGQATQDVVLLSDEMNLRGKHPEVANRLNEQNKSLIDNTNAIREAAAPDVYTTTKPAHGEALIDSYKAKDAALNKEISAKYKALTDANGGKFPLDGIAFADAAEQALHKQLLFDQVPEGMRKTLDRFKDGQSMTFENFESLRTNLARVMRSNADGNQKAAAGVIRNILEEMPMSAGAENLKPLADAARQAARERFALIEADPAYKAVVRGTASADKFIDKYVVGADLKHVQTMKQNLAHDPVAQQTMAAGTIGHLKESAGIIDNAGNFRAPGYNKALEKIRPKLDVLFEAEQKKHLENLGDVARNTTAQPRGSFVNNSNTATSLIAEQAKGAAEGAANYASGGVPLGSWVRRISGKYMEHRNVNEALQPGAGIRLKDIKDSR